jgi:hypothetical protein
MNTFGEFSPEELNSEVDSIYKELESDGYTRPRYQPPVEAQPQAIETPELSATKTVETPEAPLQTPTQPDSQLMPASDSMGPADYLLDVARGAIRGGLGAVESTADLLTLGYLPNDFLTGGIDRPKSAIGGLAEGATEFAVGFIPAFRAINIAGKAGKLAKAGSIGKWLQKSQIGRGAIAGAVADFTVFDEHEDRLSNLIQQFPGLENPVTEFLAADKDDGLLEGRLKNVLEGAMIGSAIDGIILGVKALKKARGMAEAGNAKGAEKALDDAGMQIKELMDSEITTQGLRPFSEAQVVDFDAGAAGVRPPRQEVPKGGSGYGIELPQKTASLIETAKAETKRSKPETPVKVTEVLESILNEWDEVVVRTKDRWKAAIAGPNAPVVFRDGPQKAQTAKQVADGLEKSLKDPSNKTNIGMNTRSIEAGGSALTDSNLAKFSEAQVDQVLGGLRQLTSEILRIGKEGGALNNTVVGYKPGVRAFYNPDKDMVFLGGKNRDDFTFFTPIHEIAHALTVRQIDLGLPAVSENWRTMNGEKYFNYIKAAQTNPNTNPALKGLIDSYVASAETLGVDAKLFGAVTKSGERTKNAGIAGATGGDKAVNRGVAYGFGNLYEFTAQAISSPGFQTQLAAIKLDSGKSAFRALTDAIADLLGMDIDKTMLEKVLRETAELAGSPVSRGGTKEGVAAGASRMAGDVAESDRAIMAPPAPEVSPLIKARFDEYLKVYEKDPNDLKALANAFLDDNGRPVFNLDNFNSVDEAHRSALAIMKTFEDTISRAKGEVRGASVVSQDAIDFLKKYDGTGTIMTRLAKDAQNSRQLDSRILAYYGVGLSIQDKIGKHVAEFIKARDILDRYPDDPDQLKKYAENFLAATELQQKFGSIVFGYQTIRSNAGRNLNVFKRIKEQATLVEYAKAMMEQAGGKKDVEATLDKLHEIWKKHGGAGLAKESPAGMLDMHNELWINFLLSGPKTFIVNGLGTGIVTMLKPVTSALGAHGRYIATGDTSYKMMRDEFISVYGYMMDSFKEAVELGLKAFREGDSVLQRGTSPIEKGPAITGANVNNLLKQERDANPVLAGVADFFGNVVRVPSRILTGTDEFFKQINYRSYAKAKATIEGLEALGKDGEDPAKLAQWVAARLDNIVMQDGRRYSKSAVRAQAVVEATNRFGKEGLDSLEAADFINKYISDNWDPSKSSLADYAFDVSQEVTFTRRGERNAVTGKPEFQLSTERFVSNHPALRLVVPFVTTPTNILKMVGQYTYGAIVLSTPLKKIPFLQAEKLRLARELADPDPMVQAAASGKVYMGVALTSTVIGAAAAGVITGGGPEDENEKKIKMATGWRPYSFKVGDTYVSYQRLDPFGMMLGLAADIFERSTALKAQDENPLQTAMAAMAVAFSKNITNKSYLAGIEQVVDAFSQPERFVPRLFQNRLGSYIPSAISQATGGFGDDPYMREARGWFDAVLRRVPGASGFVDPSRNILGEKIERTGIAPGIDYINPIVVSSNKNDAVMNEIAAVQHGFTQPRVIQDGGINYSDYQNANGQSAYDRWLEATSEVRINGKTLRQSLERLIKSRQYQKLGSELLEDFDSPRTREIRKVISAYRSVAKEKILREFPELNRQTNTATRVKLALRRGESVEELLSQLQQ